MPIFATMPPQYLFSSLPPPSGGGATTPSAAPPIPIPKYPPKPPKNPTPTKPIKSDVAVNPGSNNNDSRAVIITETGVGYRLPGAPFEFRYSYSETPKAKPLALREPEFLPFASPSMPRPWTGKAPLKKSKKKKVKLGEGIGFGDGVRYVTRPRDEVLGEPLNKWEVAALVKPVVSDNRQVNLGRDGVTHNMLELIHAHWKGMEVCKVRCKGVPTVDMDNVCRVLEEKTGGKIINRVGGVVYLFRGRNYDYRTRPRYPVMLWKPAAPVYPKLIQEAPEGLTKAEADKLRGRGKKLLPICKLSKNGVYITLVQDVRNAFEASPLVKIDCKGMHASDYKKLGAKLQELVPCVLLSFDDEQILLWRGQDWKSMYAGTLSVPSPTGSNNEDCVHSLGKSEDERRKRDNKTITSSKMMSLWQHAIESSKALLLDEIDLGPDDLLKKVEEFEGLRLTTEHSCSPLILSNNDRSSTSTAKFQHSAYSDKYDEDGTYIEVDNGDDIYDSDPLDEIDDQPIPLGSLPIDQIAKKLSQI